MRKLIFLGLVFLQFISCKEKEQTANSYRVARIGNDSIYYNVNSLGDFEDTMKIFSRATTILTWNNGLVRDMYIVSNNGELSRINYKIRKEKGVVFYSDTSNNLETPPPLIDGDSINSFFFKKMKIDVTIKNRIDTATLNIKNTFPGILHFSFLSGISEVYLIDNEQTIKFLPNNKRDSIRLGFTCYYPNSVGFVRKSFVLPPIDTTVK